MAITQRGSPLFWATPENGDEFGSGVALSADGTVMAVGISSKNDPVADAGAVAVYDLSGSAWVLRGTYISASDYGSSDWFGCSVALSADGSILAVGAKGWDGGTGGMGAVYLYDWSGSAWVERATILTAADGDGNDFFGAGVALSSDGSVLAVGASNWEGGSSNQGGVYVYDWSGSAWVQRGSVLTAADAAADDNFGYSVALSDDGAILVVGASLWEGGTSNQGGVYVYDWSGAAWVQRGSVITASDAAGTDFFGASLALSGSGSVLAVGAPYWEGALSNEGAVYVFDAVGDTFAHRDTVTAAAAVASDFFGVSVALSSDGTDMVVGATGWDGAESGAGAVYTFDIVVENQVIAPTALTVEAVTGVVDAPTELTVIDVISAATSLTVVNPTGTASAPSRLFVTASGSVGAPTSLAVLDPENPERWTVRCVLDGYDVSSRLVGEVTVQADEGAARIATINLIPASGPIAPLDYVGRTISIDYAPVFGGTPVYMRLFTGRVDTPEFEPKSARLSLTCVDDMQNRVAALDRGVIDSLIGGRYSTAVQGEMDDNWDYAQALMSTIGGSLDAGPHGGLRVTLWSSADVWATYDESSLLYDGSLVSRYPQRSAIVNSVTVAFDYRYPRLRQRFTSVGWSGTHIDMAPCGWQYPTQQDILGAAGGAGWHITDAAFYPAPASIPHASGGFIRPAEGSVDMAILKLTQRHAQTVTERYSMTVTAPESITANGELPHALRGALESEFDGGAWESAVDIEPLMPDGGEQDYAPDATRSDAEHAIRTLLDQAKVKILSTHRGARVTNAVPCNPDIDLDKRIAIATAEVDAAGKVASVTHILNLSTGSALTEFSIACYGAGGAGIITPDTLDPPASPEEAAATHAWESDVPSLFVNTYGVTPYAETLMGLLLNPPETVYVEDIPVTGSASVDNPYYVAGSYPVTGFRVQMPGVDDDDRNPLVKVAEAGYQVVIPVDPLAFTVP